MTTQVFKKLDEALAGIPRYGVVHAGAHKGQEVDDYLRAGFGRIVLVEANPDLRADLEGRKQAVLTQQTYAGRYPGVAVTVHSCAVGDPGVRTFYRTAWSERSSLLRPTLEGHVDTIDVDVRPLAELQVGCNVAVLDIQGAELEALQTADLTQLDAVIVECFDETRYKGACVRDEVDEFMAAAGWHQVAEYGGHSHATLVDVVWHRKAPR